MHSSNCPWLVGIQQHVHSLLHYTFSKPEAAFNFIKKRVKTTWLPALLSVGVCVFSPLYIPIFFRWLTAPASPSTGWRSSAALRGGAGAHLVAEQAPSAVVERLRSSSALQRLGLQGAAQMQDRAGLAPLTQGLEACSHPGLCLPQLLPVCVWL